MANPAHVSKLTVEGVKAWNEMQAALGPAGPMVAELQDADLSGKDLSGADLRGARLQGAKLRGTKFGAGTLLWNANITKADAYQADFSDAWLDDADFTGTDLFEAKFRDATLRGAELSNTDGFLRSEQFAGADLTGVKLPERLKKLYEDLENVKGISESARTIFLAVLAACLYCWLTIATTTDVNLITNRASSPLPIIQTQIPIVGFYVVAPLLVLCVYFYFHFYLQKLWEELGSLPAVFPDGRPLHTKVDPWLLNDLVRAHLHKLSVNRPFLSYLQQWNSVLLAWWIVPMTMLLFWGRYLRRRGAYGSTLHVILLAISIAAAFSLYRLAVATLQGRDRKPLTWKGGLTSRSGYLTIVIFLAAGTLFGWVARETRVAQPFSLVARELSRVGYSTGANLIGAEVSQKKASWDPSSAQESNVIGAQLDWANLRYALGDKAFLSGASLVDTDLRFARLINADLSHAILKCADLSDADLAGADLSGADLRHADLFAANLFGARLEGADLRDAILSVTQLVSTNLTDADLRGAKLNGAVMWRANLIHADLRKAKGLDLKMMREASHWDQALYDEPTLSALGLPVDHNEKLEEQLQKQKETQQRQNGVERPCNPRY